MKDTSGRFSTIITLSSLLFTLIFFLAFAPTQLGGAVTNVIVDGNSMEPGFFLGDLVLVRTEPVYRVGDAVIYQDPNMGSFVFHRIIGTELDRFVLQGDNNSWLDSYRPAQDEIAGKLWIHIPKLGKAIEWARVPINMSLTAGLMGVVLMFDMFKKPSQRKKEKQAPLSNYGGLPEGILYSFGFSALLFIALGIYSFTRPLHRPADDIPYQQDGYYYYSATGTPGIYDTEVVRSGEPVFPKLTCFLNIGFTYNIVGERLQGISGTHDMSARIMDAQSGWSRKIPLNTQTSFSGNSYFTLATLDLCQIESLVNLVEQEAGLNQTAYTLEIIASAAFTASVDGMQISDSFSPRLVFKYDKVHFYLVTDKSQSDDPLRSAKQGLAGSSTSQPNTISMLGFKPAVWIIRSVSLLGLTFSLSGLFVAGMKVYRTARQSQEALIRLKYGSMLVDVYEQNLAPSASVIDVATMEDLARLAERHGTMILHRSQNFLHSYIVQNSGITYRYLISTGKKGTIESEPPGDGIAEQTEHVNKDTAGPPEPIRSETSVYRADDQGNKTTDTLPIRSEKTKPVVIRTNESKLANGKPVHKKSMGYFIDMVALQNAVPVPKASLEYVIDTGEIEVVLPEQETRILRKIKF
jgi:signal peptidase I